VSRGEEASTGAATAMASSKASRRINRGGALSSFAIDRASLARALISISAARRVSTSSKTAIWASE
jgi:hypothetical protein